MEKQEKLLEFYREYVDLLGDEISDLMGIALVHGWKSTRYEQGKELREKIKELERV